MPLSPTELRCVLAWAISTREHHERTVMKWTKDSSDLALWKQELEALRVAPQPAAGVQSARVHKRKLLS